nr:MAG TPA: hypothetical protein [Bacteriophage sp.]
MESLKCYKSADFYKEIVLQHPTTIRLQCSNICLQFLRKRNVLKFICII